MMTLLLGEGTKLVGMNAEALVLMKGFSVVVADTSDTLILLLSSSGKSYSFTDYSLDSCSKSLSAAALVAAPLSFAFAEVCCF